MDMSSIEEELLTCELCEELVFTEERDLHMLPCQHNLCTMCVQGIVKKKDPRGALSCPWCRKKFVVDKEENLPKHRYAEKLSELIKNFQIDENVKIPTEKLEEGLDGYPRLVQLFNLQKHQSGTEVRNVVIEGNKIYMVYPDVPGIIYHDIVGDRRAQKLSRYDSMYGDISIIDDELYAYNMTEGLIEVYKNLTLSRHWKLALPSPFLEERNNPFCSLSTRLVAAPMGLFVIVAAAYHDISYTNCWLFTKTGTLVEITHTMKRNDLETWKQLLDTNTDISVDRCSLWIYSKEENCLLQVSIKPLNSTKVKIGAPIRHCRISGYKCSHGIDDSKLLYCTNGEPDIVKVIDLESLTKASCVPNKRAQKRAYKDAARGRNYLRTVGVGEVSKITVDSSGTYIGLVESKALHLYQMKPAESPIPASNDQPTQTDNTITHFTTGQSSQTENDITLYTEDHRPVEHCTQTDEKQVSTRELSVLVSKKLALCPQRTLCVFMSLMMKFFKSSVKCLSRGVVEFHDMILGFLVLICILVVTYKNK